MQQQKSIDRSLTEGQQCDRTAPYYRAPTTKFAKVTFKVFQILPRALLLLVKLQDSFERSDKSVQDSVRPPEETGTPYHRAPQSKTTWQPLLRLPRPLLPLLTGGDGGAGAPAPLDFTLLPWNLSGLPENPTFIEPF